ncbi:MAG: primosomal protein N' [Candidatus Moraniibacteriota bacterium]
MTEEKSQFILSIVPLVRIPLSREQFFYYLSDEKLPAGTLVSIPFSKKTIEGIVIESKSDFERSGGMVLKKVEKILEENFLTEQQLKLASHISDYYLASLGIVMKNFAVKQMKRNPKKSETQIEKKSEKKITLTSEQQKAVISISKNTSKEIKFDNHQFLLFGPAGAGKTEVYIHSMLELKKQNPQSQFLILVPEKTLTPQALERYGVYFEPEEIALLSSNLSKGAFFANWSRIKSGEAKIIIGTRMAVFAPFQKLALIVIDEEQDMSFKSWDMSPRYDARNVAKKLAELNHCKIVFGSATPSIESFYQTQIKKYQLLELPPLKLEILRQPPSETILVDMRKERWIKNYSCISKKLKAEIAYALKNRLQTILFINRQGMSAFSVCDNCKTVLSCPACDRALVYGNSGNYKCTHCSFISSAIPECSKCKKIVFRNVGLGTQKVEKEVASFFPNAKILRIDTEKIKEKDFQADIYQKFSQGEFDILIGTQMITKGWDLPRVSLVGVIDTDNMFSFPTWNAQEKAYQDLVQLSGRVARPGARFPGMVIIQTYHPENKLLQAIVQKNYPLFYQKELSDREALSYPPFGKIAKLVFQDYNKPRVDEETKKGYDRLTEAKNELKITEPQDCFIPKIRGKFRKQIIIKFDSSLPEKTKQILKSLPSGWIIDIDPISTT